MWRLWFSFCGRLIAIGVCCCLTLVLPNYWVHNLLHVAIALLALQMTRQFTNNILWLHLHFFLLMMNAIVMNRSIDDNDRVIVLIVSMDVFSRLFIWIKSWIQIWFWFFDLTVITHYALTKFVCQWQRAEFIIFLLMTSSLVLKLVFWFLQFLWRQFRQPKWCSFVWFRNCGGSHWCLLWRLFFTPQMHFWFINKRNYDDENETIYHNCDCNDDKVYEPSS